MRSVRPLTLTSCPARRGLVTPQIFFVFYVFRASGEGIKRASLAALSATGSRSSGLTTSSSSGDARQPGWSPWARRRGGTGSGRVRRRLRTRAYASYKALELRGEVLRSRAELLGLDDRHLKVRSEHPRVFLWPRCTSVARELRGSSSALTLRPSCRPAATLRPILSLTCLGRVLLWAIGGLLGVQPRYGFARTFDAAKFGDDLWNEA